jgi:CheY-like chemotaxis protein
MAEQRQQKGTTKSAQRGEETILPVKDEPANLKLIRIMPEKQGYTVLAATTPGEAIRLLMTDVVRPEMNGRDLAAKVRVALDCE